MGIKAVLPRREMCIIMLFQIDELYVRDYIWELDQGRGKDCCKLRLETDHDWSSCLDLSVHFNVNHFFIKIDAHARSQTDIQTSTANKNKTIKNDIKNTAMTNTLLNVHRIEVTTDVINISTQEPTFPPNPALPLFIPLCLCSTSQFFYHG